MPKCEKNKRLHIAHVLHSFRVGGLENGVVNLINSLPDSKYSHSIICITDYCPQFFKRIQTNNCEIYCLNKPPGKSILWIFKCWKLFRTIKPDVVHSRNLSALESQLAKFFTGSKLSVHGEHGWDVGDIGGSNTKNQRMKRILRPLIDQYIALSSEGEAYLIDKVLVPPARVNRICNGVDVYKFNPDTPPVDIADMPAGFAQDPQRLTFGTVGRLARVKNQPYLLEAFIALVKQNLQHREQLRLIIVGEGILLADMQEMAKQHQVEDLVWFAGSRDDVPAIMTHLDVFVLPSLAEGISNVFLEAMAAGLPVIATRVGGNSDLMHPKHASTHLVEVDKVPDLMSAMQQYVGHVERVATHAREVRAHCLDNFSINSMVDKYDAVYQRVLG